MNQAALRLCWKYLQWPLWLACAIVLLVGLRHGMTPTFDGASISPYNIYRLEYYKASPLQRIWHYEKAMPTFTRLYRIAPEALLGESAMVDLWLNTELHWSLHSSEHSVRLGSDVVFENLAQECTDCPALVESRIRP